VRDAFARDGPRNVLRRLGLWLLFVVNRPRAEIHQTDQERRTHETHHREPPMPTQRCFTSVSRRNFDHRKLWIQDRLEELAGIVGLSCSRQRNRSTSRLPGGARIGSKSSPFAGAKGISLFRKAARHKQRRTAYED